MPSHCAVVIASMKGRQMAWARPQRKRRNSGGGVKDRSFGPPVSAAFSSSSAAMARKVRAEYMSCKVTPASEGVWRRIETKRAASSEWPPRSMKKSASKGRACGGSTFLAASSRIASVGVRGSSCSSCEAATVVSGSFFRTLRLTLPEERRGRESRDLVARGNHIGRQRRAQVGADRFGIERDALFRHQKGDKLVEAVVVAQDHRRLVDAGQIGELGFDFAQFDAKAANFDLIVDAAVETDLAIGRHHHGVAGTVEDGIAAGAIERIGDEFFGRQRIALEIAARHARAADQQFALDAALQQIVGLVGDIAGVIGDGAADGHRRRSGCTSATVATTVASVGP